MSGFAGSFSPAFCASPTTRDWATVCPCGSPSSDGEIKDTPPRTSGFWPVNLSVSPDAPVTPKCSKSTPTSSYSLSTVLDPLEAYSLSGVSSTQKRRAKRPPASVKAKAKAAGLRLVRRATPPSWCGWHGFVSRVRNSVVGWRGILRDQFGVHVPGSSAIVGGSSGRRPAIVGGGAPRRSATK